MRGCTPQVGEALAKRKQPPVAAAGAFGPDPDTQAVSADDRDRRLQGCDGALAVAAIDEQVPGQSTRRATPSISLVTMRPAASAKSRSCVRPIASAWSAIRSLGGPGLG
jgi:hypothetical protein